jgi:GH24 family phage-related lysozyme (muramidase)
LRQQILAGIKELRELEYQLRQFSLDSLGLPIDLNIPAIRDMQNQINGVLAQARDGLDAVNRLKELGIEVINDAGSLIYRDSLGNTLVDFSNGVGPVASSLAIQSEVARTYNNIKSAITVPINNNQAQALAAFARDIGAENFRNSNVLDALNAGKYSEIPRLMAQWSLGPPVGATTPTPRNNLVYRQDLNDARYFQGQVFQSPDNLDIGPPEGTNAGGLTAREMGNIIKARREEFNAANVVGPTEYYGGPGR